MSWQSPPIGAITIDYRGARFLLGRTQDGYAIWDAEGGGEPLERHPLTAEGWQSAWQSYLAREGPRAREQASAWLPSPQASWQRGQRLTMAPMRVGQLIDGAFKLYRMHFRTVVPAVALVVIPFQAVALLLTLSTLEPVVISEAFPSLTTEQPAVWVTFLVTGLDLLVVTPFLTATVVQIAADAFLGEGTSVRRAYRVALRRAPSILWVTILLVLAMVAVFIPVILLGVAVAATGDEGLAVLVVLLVLLVLVPAMFLFLRWLFATSIVVVEGHRGTRALRRSWQLARGLTGKLLGTMLLVILIVYALYIIVGIIVGILFVILVPSTGAFLQGGGIGAGFYAATDAVETVMRVLTTPFLTLVVVLLYFDARMRKEGFDLEVMADQLGDRA